MRVLILLLSVVVVVAFARRATKDDFVLPIPHVEPTGEVPLSQVMWQSSFPIAVDALKSPFLQGIANGTLDPARFGSYTVQDIYYLEQAVKSWQIIMSKTTDPTILAYVTHETSAYEIESNDEQGEWGIQQVVAGSVITKYSAMQSNASQNSPPEVAIAAFAPCIVLWSWLGEQIPPPSPANVYASWINNMSNPKGVARVNAVIDYAASLPNFDSNLALTLFQEAMQYEHDFFWAY